MISIYYFGAEALIKNGTGLAIQKELGVSQSTVSSACSGTRNSDLSKKIRQMAVALGGDPIWGYIPEKIKNGNTRIIAERFKVTMQTVRNAKRGVINNQRAQDIRRALTELENNNQ